MFPNQIPDINPDEFFRCKERKQVIDHGKSLSPIEKADAIIKGAICEAIWKDDVLRATDYHEIDVHVKNGVVHLSGHILGGAAQGRINNAIQSIPGILKIQNNFVLDEELTLSVASALGKLEHEYHCKFFTGTSHGVVSLNGLVSNENVKLLAEKYASNNPNVRGVINNIRVSGIESKVKDSPFLQPVIGEVIYFLDGAHGDVQQVIINPNNRRVIYMTLQGIFTDDRYELHSQSRSPQQQLIMVPMSAVRHLTRISGFLLIKSSEKNRYVNFNPTDFVIPHQDWIPPYPYCSEDVLIPAKYQNADNPAAKESEDPFPFGAILEEASIRDQFFATDSFGV